MHGAPRAHIKRNDSGPDAGESGSEGPSPHFLRGALRLDRQIAFPDASLRLALKAASPESEQAIDQASRHAVQRAAATRARAGRRAAIADLPAVLAAELPVLSIASVLHLRCGAFPKRRALIVPGECAGEPSTWRTVVCLPRPVGTLPHRPCPPGADNRRHAVWRPGGRTCSEFLQQGRIHD